MLAGGGKPKLKRRHPREWTKAKTEAFVAALAETCNVTAAAAAAGISHSAVYARRLRDAEFRASWAVALREGYARLELMLLERAMNGTVKTVERSGGGVDRTTEYPNAMAMRLLHLHRSSAAAAEAEPAPEDIEAVRERILRKLAAVKRRGAPGGTGAGE